MKIIKKYFPDLIVIIGVWLLSYGLFSPAESIFSVDLDFTNHHINEKIIGVVLIVIGIDIFIRKYLINKKR